MVIPVLNDVEGLSNDGDSALSIDGDSVLSIDGDSASSFPASFSMISAILCINTCMIKRYFEGSLQNYWNTKCHRERTPKFAIQELFFMCGTHL